MLCGKAHCPGALYCNSAHTCHWAQSHPFERCEDVDGGALHRVKGIFFFIIAQKETPNATEGAIEANGSQHNCLSNRREYHVQVCQPHHNWNDVSQRTPCEHQTHDCYWAWRRCEISWWQSSLELDRDDAYTCLIISRRHLCCTQFYSAIICHPVCCSLPTTYINTLVNVQDHIVDACLYAVVI